MTNDIWYTFTGASVIRDYEKPVFVENRTFRTKETNKYFESAFKESINFPQSNGLVVSKDYVRFVCCPICKLKENKQLFVKWGFKIVVCDNCNHTYVENQVIQSKLEELYTTSEVDQKFQERKKKNNGLDEYWTLIYEKYLQLLREKSIQNTALLDVGAGGGDFIGLCDETASYDLHALEFSERSAGHLISIVGKNNFYREDITNVDFHGRKFGVITMWGVLEHLSGPMSTLKKCKEILDDDGRILILVPNLYSRAFQILGITVPTLNPRSHLSFFSKRSMEYLCTSVGLKVEAYYQELPIIDLMYEFIDYSDDFVKEIIDNNESYYSVYLLAHNNIYFETFARNTAKHLIINRTHPVK
jgi:2-polyprenyl-3-methyl-5-hydroxy-6-metoxy-1,4-benzoquinol methylase